MTRMRRTLGILPVAALVLAACAAPGSGGGDTDSSATDAAAASAPAASSSAAGASDSLARVDIGDLYADPSAFAGQEVTILGRVDSIAVDGGAFLTSPSGEAEGLLVVLAEDATIDKEIAEKRVVWITGSVVPFTSDDLAAAGAAVSADDVADYGGEYALVATEIGDPLSGE